MSFAHLISRFMGMFGGYVPKLFPSLDAKLLDELRVRFSRAMPYLIRH
jgi:hypothetical protein